MSLEAVQVSPGVRFKDSEGDGQIVAVVPSSIGDLALVQRSGGLGAVPVVSLSDEDYGAEYVDPDTKPTPAKKGR